MENLKNLQVFNLVGVYLPSKISCDSPCSEATTQYRMLALLFSQNTLLFPDVTQHHRHQTLPILALLSSPDFWLAGSTLVICMAKLNITTYIFKVFKVVTLRENNKCK